MHLVLFTIPLLGCVSKCPYRLCWLGIKFLTFFKRMPLFEVERFSVKWAHSDLHKQGIPRFTWLPISSEAWISWHQHHQELSLQGLHGPELPSWGDSRRQGDSWHLLLKVDPPSSLKNKRPGRQPAARRWETCFKICACWPCHHMGPGKQAALRQNSFANQSCLREAGGVSSAPLCRDQARMTMSECEWKKQQSAFHVHGRRAKTQFYLKINPLSWALKASLGHQENPSFKIY